MVQCHQHSFQGQNLSKLIKFMLKNRGDSIEPWGTPQSIFEDLLKQFLILLRWIWLSKYEKVSLIDACDTPYLQSVASSNESSMQSHAFERSVKSAPNSLLLSSASLNSSVIIKRQCESLNPFFKSTLA